jgi:O-antigen ligase
MARNTTLLRAPKPIVFTPSEDNPYRLGRPLILVAAALLCVPVILILNGHPTLPVLVIGGLGGAIFLAWAAVYTSRHTEWVILPLILIEFIIAASILGTEQNDKYRSLLHYFILFIFCLPLIPKVYRSKILYRGGFLLYVIYFGWCAISILYSVDPLYSTARLLTAVLGLIALAACASEIGSSDDAYRMLGIFVLGCSILMGIVAASLVLLPHGLTWSNPLEGLDPEALKALKHSGAFAALNRFQSIFGQPNVVGTLMLVTVSSSAIYWRKATRRQKWALAGVIAMALFSDVLADSRTPFIALVIGAVCYSIWKYRLRSILVLCGAAVVALIVFVAIGGDITAYVSRGNVGTLTGRTEIWLFALQQVKDQPILGYGYDVGGAIFDFRYFPIWYGPWDMGPHSSLHNGYLTHLVGIGVPATLFWLYIMLRPWVYVARQKNDQWNLKPFVFLLVIPLLIENMAESAIGDCTGGVGVLFALAWIIAERYRMLSLEQTVIERQRLLERMPSGVRAIVYRTPA